MPFEAGKSGNPGGKPKQKPFRDALNIELASALNGEECLAPKGSLRWNARQLIEMGEIAAIKEIADRLDGKVAQAIVGGDEDDPAIKHITEIRLVAKKD